MLFSKFVWIRSEKGAGYGTWSLIQDKAERFSACRIHPPRAGTGSLHFRVPCSDPLPYMDLTIIKYPRGQPENRFMHRFGVPYPCNPVVSQINSALAIRSHLSQITGISSPWTVNRWCLYFLSFSLRPSGPTPGVRLLALNVKPALLQKDKLYVEWNIGARAILRCVWPNTHGILPTYRRYSPR